MQIHSQAMLGWNPPLEEDAKLASSPAPSNFRILIVNEDMRNADSLKRTLNDLGYFTTCTAYSARRALHGLAAETRGTHGVERAARDTSNASLVVMSEE